MNRGELFHNCADCPSRRTTEWRALNADELALVSQAKRTRAHEPGEALYHQGDPGVGIYCIQSGLVGLRRTDENGNSSLLRLCAAGTTIGYQSYLSKEPHKNTAEVLTPTTACFIERSLVSNLLSTNPRLGERFLQHLLDDMSAIEDDYARSLTLSVKSRFLHTLMVFYEKLGYRDENGQPIVELPIKRMELADLIGAQPASISRLIRKVQAEGMLKFNDRRVSITDMEAVLREMGAAL